MSEFSENTKRTFSDAVQQIIDSVGKSESKELAFKIIPALTEIVKHEKKIQVDRIELNKRISELENICAESYQVVGWLADECDLFDHEQVIKALDNLSEQKMLHDDVLPFHPKEIKK